jgi:hypothetical protein
VSRQGISNEIDPAQVAVYSITGAKVYEGAVQAGTTARCPDVLIITAGNCTQKVINR